MTGQPLLEIDRDHIWHPYASMIDPPPVFAVKAAVGTRLILEDDRELIDGMASWWSAIHGYNHPALNEAAYRQIEKMSHVMFGGLTHRPAIALASMLLGITPEPLDKIFFCDSGSVAVEVAIKMAIQYQQARGRGEKRRLATVRSGYHGDTFGAMAVCDPDKGMHRLFSGVLAEHHFADAPRCGFEEPFDESDIRSLAEILEQHGPAIAAVIIEPIVQGAGGMRFYSPEYLRRLRKLCDAHDVLLIFDEIATGFGRTGYMFAANIARVCPDILCIGKALTGGYMSLAAAITTEAISDVISQEGQGAFMHGPTFMANPLACAVAEASIKLLIGTPWQKRVRAIEGRLKERLLPLGGNGRVRQARVLGAIGVLELEQDVDLRKIQPLFVERGVWLRPFGNLVYTLPPFVITDEELDYLTEVMADVVSNADIF